MRRALHELPAATALAVALVVVELLARVVVGSYPGATALLVLACGAALAPFLPNELDRPTLRAAVVPALGMASFAVVLTTISIAGVPLTDASIHLAVAGLVTALAVAARATATPGAATRAPSRREAYAAALLLGVVCFGLLSAWDSVGPFPPPAVDWGHYLLYADEVEKQGALLIDDPYAGVDGRLFANSPGVGALYGGVRIVDGVPSHWLAYGIVVISALTALSVFVLAGALWGLRAGVAASAFWVVAPIHMDTIRWHGVGTNLALLYVPLAVLGLALLYRGARGWRIAVFLGGSLIGVAAMHSTSAFLVGCLVLVAVAIDLVRQGLRHRLAVRLWWQDGILRTLLAGLAFAAVAGAGVLVHVRAQAADLGRPIDASMLEPDWLSWQVLVDFFAPGFLVLTAVSALVVLAASGLRRDPALLAVLALLVTCAAVSELWRLEISFEYRRVVFYAGVALAVLIGVAMSRLVRGPISAVAAVVVLVYVVHGSIGLRLPARLLTDLEPKGKESVTIKRFGDALQRGDVRDASLVITDRCHTFVVPYLLRRPTIIAFEPWQVGFESRVPLAAKGVAILQGGERGRRLARSLDVGYVVANPTCTPGLPARLGGSVVVAEGDVVVIDVRESTGEA